MPRIALYHPLGDERGTSLSNGAGLPSFPMKLKTRTFFSTAIGVGTFIPASWASWRFLYSLSVHMSTISAVECGISLNLWSPTRYLSRPCRKMAEVVRKILIATSPPSPSVPRSTLLSFSDLIMYGKESRGYRGTDGEGGDGGIKIVLPTTASIRHGQRQ